MKQITVKKGEFLQRKGDLNSKVFHVESGLLRSYSIDAKGREHIHMFAPEGWIVVDNVMPDEPCELFIDALEDSVICKVEKDEAFQTVSTMKLIRRMLSMQRRITMLLSASALERYNMFLKNYPGIVLRVPQKMIASYLGMTPEALSTVKRQRGIS